jgi:hypothetical protein
MSIKSFFAKIWAAQAVKQTLRLQKNAAQHQLNVLNKLVQTAKHTRFGSMHHFDKITDYDAYKKQVPLFTYEKLAPFINEILAGKADILWKGKPIYFAKTSGTTSGEKYIPITKASIRHHIVAARNALFFYIYETGNTSFIKGKMIFLQGSPVLEKKANINTGRLSGIVYHHVPTYLHQNRKPSYATNCIDDWEQKVDAIVDETKDEPMTLISGIPPWLVMYFEKLLLRSGAKNITTLFPDLSLLVYGGVNYLPYRQKINDLIGKPIDSIETYPASEGFIAYQDQQEASGMLLNLEAGIFYEFIEEKNIRTENPVRHYIGSVELHKNYAIVLTTNAGLWSYIIGDVVQFTSLNPFRIKVTGRISQFVSAFGEHVIIEEIEYAMTQAIEKFNIHIKEFTVAPQVNPAQGLPYHEWLVAGAIPAEKLEEIATYIDTCLQTKNSYYKDLIAGHVIRPLQLTILPPDAFEKHLAKMGKLGGQNKVMRVRNDRQLADALLAS